MPDSVMDCCLDPEARANPSSRSEIVQTADETSSVWESTSATPLRNLDPIYGQTGSSDGDFQFEDNALSAAESSQSRIVLT